MNVKGFSWVAFGALLAIDAVAQPYAVGIRSQAMAGSGVADGQDAEAIFANPALLASLPGASVTLFYSHPFGLREINLASISVAAKFANLGCGLAVIHFGDDIYRDRYYQAALAHKFGNDAQFTFAVAANLRHLSIRGYGSAMALGLNFGTAFRLNSKVCWGVFLGNINQPAIGAAQEKLPQAICVGVAFSPLNDWRLQLDFHREFDFAEEIRFGAETRVLSILLLRLGAATNPDRFSAGFAIELSSAALNMAATSHSDLGTTEFYAISMGRRQRAGEKER